MNCAAPHLHIIEAIETACDMPIMLLAHRAARYELTVAEMLAVLKEIYILDEVEAAELLHDIGMGSAFQRAAEFFRAAVDSYCVAAPVSVAGASGA